MVTTIQQFIKQATPRLADSPSPRLDAEVLVMHVTGLGRSQLITRAADPLTSPQQSRLEELLTRRAHGEPVAYLTGKREFWSMELMVTPDVLIPRPETELLVEQALARIPTDAVFAIADLGTGSGAVALAIARERPRCRVIATDASEAALSVARANAERLGIRRVEFRHGKWCAPLAGEEMDIIVSNPPYVAANDPHLREGDLRFEPRHALVSGAEGLDAIRQLVATATRHLRPGGWLALEHGAEQRAAVAALFAAHGYENIKTSRDLAGLDRVTVAQRPRPRPLTETR